MMIDNGLLDHVTQQFLNALHRDAKVVQESAAHLFYFLVVIQLALSGLAMVLMGDNLITAIAKWIKLASLFGVLYALNQFGCEWIPQLLNGFIELGQKSGVTSLDPSSVIDQGIAISSAVLHGFWGWGLLEHPVVSLMGAIVCIALIVLYSLIAAELVMALLKAYVLVATNAFFFALAAADFTREMTKNYCRTLMGLGLHLMTLYLLLGVGQNLGVEWAHMTKEAAQQDQLMPMLAILAAVIVYYFILKNLPAFMAGLAGVSGFRHEGAVVVGMAINAGKQGQAVLGQGHQALKQGLGGGAQALQTLAHAGASFQRGFQKAEGGLSGIRKGVSQVVSDLSHATANTIKNSFHSSASSSTMGKFNQHLANRVRPSSKETKGN